jgi:hypothetical protein
MGAGKDDYAHLCLTQSSSQSTFPVDLLKIWATVRSQGPVTTAIRVRARIGDLRMPPREAKKADAGEYIELEFWHSGRSVWATSTSMIKKEKWTRTRDGYQCVTRSVDVPESRGQVGKTRMPSISICTDRSQTISLSKK